MNQHAKYLGQRSYSSKVTDGTHTHGQTHKPDRLLHHITMNSRVMMTTWNDYNYTVIPQRQISTTPMSVYLQCTHVGRSTQSLGTTKICGHVQERSGPGKPGLRTSIATIRVTCSARFSPSPTAAVFTARRSYASAVLGVVILSVRPSVRLSHACFVTNPKNLPAIFLYHMKGQSF